MKTRLTREEKDLLASFDNGEWLSVDDMPQRKAELQKMAASTLRKDRRLNIRISERDLLELQRLTSLEGLPYQTYVASILHKFVSGTLD